MTQHAAIQRCTKQYSVFLHKPACPLQHLCHPHRLPKQVPGIPPNSSSSWIPTINHSPSPPVSAKGSRSITLPDGLPGVVDSPLPLNSSHLSPPPTVPPWTSLPALTLEESLTSEPLHTSRFTTVTVGGGRGPIIGTHFFGGMCVNTKKVFQPNYYYLLQEQNQREGLE